MSYPREWGCSHPQSHNSDGVSQDLLDLWSLERLRMFSFDKTLNLEVAKAIQTALAHPQRVASFG